VTSFAYAFVTQRGRRTRGATKERTRLPSRTPPSVLLLLQRCSCCCCKSRQERLPLPYSIIRQQQKERFEWEVVFFASACTRVDCYHPGRKLRRTGERNLRWRASAPRPDSGQFSRRIEANDRRSNDFWDCVP